VKKQARFLHAAEVPSVLRGLSLRLYSGSSVTASFRLPMVKTPPVKTVAFSTVTEVAPSRNGADNSYSGGSARDFHPTSQAVRQLPRSGLLRERLCAQRTSDFVHRTDKNADLSSGEGLRLRNREDYTVGKSSARKG
jgi:hypothetical protein